MSHAIQPTPTSGVSLRSYLTSPIREPSDTSVTFMHTCAKHFSRKDFLVKEILSILKKSVELSMKVQARPSLVLLLKLMNGQSKQNASQLDPWDKVGESREQRDAARSWQAGVVRYTYILCLQALWKDGRIGLKLKISLFVFSFWEIRTNPSSSRVSLHRGLGKYASQKSSD